MNESKSHNQFTIMSDKIECWIILDNNHIIKKLVDFGKERFQYADKTYFLGNKYCTRKFKILFIPITRLCLFYSQASPYPLEFNPLIKRLSDGTIMPITFKYVTPEQITERFKQGAHYVKMSMESSFDILMQKIQFYGIIGCLIMSMIILLKMFGGI